MRPSITTVPVPAAAGLLLAGIYYTAFQWLVIKDWGREDYTYGYLIPAVALYLIWEKRKEFRSTEIQPSWAGFILLIPGIVLFWLGELSGEVAAGSVALLA